MNGDEALRRQKHHIDIAGWAVTAVVDTDSPTGAPFTYTVGLVGCDHPELLIVGLPYTLAHALLNDMAGRVYDDGDQFSHGQRISDLIIGHDVVIVEGPVPEVMLPGAAVALYGRARVRLQQIVWPDRAGQYPWDPAYALGPEVQPLIGRL